MPKSSGTTDFLHRGLGLDKAQKDASDMVTGVEVVIYQPGVPTPQDRSE